jgi:DMATS type aromatic prenyltransferase
VQSLGFDRQLPKLVEGFNALVDPWGDQLIGDDPEWLSDICYDATPIEFSIAFESEQPEIRILIEPQGNPTTLLSSWEIGCQINESLERQFGASLERFQQIQHLFVPKNPNTGCSMFIGFGLTKDGDSTFKIYLNPDSAGPDKDLESITEALAILGFSKAGKLLSQLRQLRQNDRFILLSLDLVHYRAARVKVYLAAPDPTVEHLEKLMSASPAHKSGDVLNFCRGILGSETKFNHRPTLVCFAFTAEDDSCPYTTTLQVPVRNYLKNDAVAYENIYNFLSPSERDYYQRAIIAMADRPLDLGASLTSFASFKRERGEPRTTIYLNLEAYGMMPPNN